MCNLCDAYDDADNLIVFLNKLLGKDYGLVGEDDKRYSYAEKKFEDDNMYDL